MRMLIITMGACLLFQLTSCEKAFMEAEPKADPQTVFKTLWKAVDRKYSLFRFKEVDWDSVRRVYKPKIRPGMSDRALFDVLAGMLNTLKDGHVNLVSDFDRSRYWDWYLDYPQNFDFSLLERQYLGDQYRISDHFKIYYRKFDTLSTSIGYMYVPSFVGAKPEVLDGVLQQLSGCDGLIIDVRNNGGGYASLAETLAGRFTEKQRKFAYWQWKDGPAHDDFTKLSPRYIKPEGYLQFTKPIAVLVNRSSYSATNHFALAMKVLPHATLIGDVTGGGGGIPRHNQLPNGWTYRISTTITWSLSMKNVESGIKPDIPVDMKPAGQRKQKDAILERGMTFISRQ